jgi:hypothetical protein
MFKIGHKPWNKGLTKETDPRVKKYAELGQKQLNFNSKMEEKDQLE